ncbi:DUF551 domain-containing protein [Klebsiella quasipneumoniae]|uniref:DUF551 domain-containing protein n=1 Tax=Klebsiella quasipneumoniae TaxID=1463165 RepID=UPI00387A1860
MARMALAAMDSESGCLPLDYLQGHKDGLEWAAQLAEANHPETGEWLYDDPIELAKAIRKGPDMPPAQPAADSEPVAWTWQHLKQWHVTNDEERARDLAWDGIKVDPLYRHAQPVPVVPDDYQRLRELYHAQEKRLFKIAQRIKGPSFDKYSHTPSQAIDVLEGAIFGEDDACRAAMLAAAPHDTPALNSVQSVVTVPGKWIPVSERMPEDRTQVILWDAEIGEVTSGHYSHKTQTFYHCGDAIENEITHWMLPPSAPQGVKP